MNFSDILNGIGNFFGKIKNTVDSMIPSQTITVYGKNYKAPVTQTPAPIPTPTTLSALSTQINNGLSKWGNGNAPPIATQSAQLAKAGENLPDKLLPTIMSIMETRGLRDKVPQQNANPYNIFYPGTQTPVNYEGNPDTAILGGRTPSGQEKMGFSGILRPGGIYQDYLDSGDLSDFFAHYTPPSDPNNPPIEELIRRYHLIRENFNQ